MYVHKDIGLYEEKLVGGLSARMAACVAAGAASSLLAGALLQLSLGISPADAGPAIMAASVPFWLLGFWRPCGMRPEEFIPLVARHAADEGRIRYVPAASLAAPDPGIAAASNVKPRALRRLVRKGGEAHGILEAEAR